MANEELIAKCHVLLDAYSSGALGKIRMPEDSNPGFSNEESEKRIAYFTLPMALNYQRNSYSLWEAALKSYNDKETAAIFDINQASQMSVELLRQYLTRYKLALQPNKHIVTWQTLANTVAKQFGSFTNLVENVGADYLALRELVQFKQKKSFPYLSGPKIFNYWCFVLQQYAGVTLKNSEFIEIAPDTHITQASVRLCVISAEQAESMPKEKISKLWRKELSGSGIDPIQMHSPLWFWSRNNFTFKMP